MIILLCYEKEVKLSLLVLPKKNTDNSEENLNLPWGLGSSDKASLLERSIYRVGYENTKNDKPTSAC